MLPQDENPSFPPQKRSLLAALEDTKGSEYTQLFEQDKSEGFIPEGKSSNMYYSGLAHKKLPLERVEGEWSVERKVQKLQVYFDVFDDYLCKNSKLRLEGAFKKMVTDLCSQVFNLCYKKGQDWINSKIPGEERGPRRVGIKYVFIAALYNCLKSKSLSSGGQFLFELSLNEIMKCFQHLDVCKGSLAKYIILVRSIGKEQGIEVGNSNDRVLLFNSILRRLVSIMVKESKIFNITETTAKFKKKMIKAMNRFALLNPELLQNCLGTRPVAHNAFAVFSLCLLSLGINHIQLPHLLEICQKEEPHLSSSSYFPVNSCVRHWKEQLIKRFRDLKCLPLTSGVGLFFWHFKSQEKLMDQKNVHFEKQPEQNIDARLQREQNPIPGPSEDVQSDIDSVLGDPLGKRYTGKSQAGDTLCTEQNNTGVVQSAHEVELRNDDEPTNIVISGLEKSNFQLILKAMLKSSTLNLLGINPDACPLDLSDSSAN